MNIPPDLAGVTTMIFDVDGTLTGADHLVGEPSLRALRALDAAGVQLVIASGRTPRSCADTFERAGLHGWISACNGAHVSDLSTGEVLRRVTVPPEMIRGALKICREADIACSVFTSEAMYVSKHTFLTGFLEASNPGASVELADLGCLDPDSVLKLMPGAEKEQMAELFPRFKKICPNATLSLDQTCEIVGPGAEKADAISFLIEHLGLDPAQTGGVGDGGNDVAWLQLVGWPIAMANARPEVKDVARLVIGHHLEDGVEQFVQEWLEARRQSRL